jgi:surface antigen
MIRIAAALLIALATLAPMSPALASPGKKAAAAQSAQASVQLAALQTAVTEAQSKRSRGERVWCVPFARTASGVEIKGNAKTWWAAAEGRYDRGNQPMVGAVMVFSGSRSMPMGHVAVVSEVVNDRIILIDHANWKRNQVSLDMAVIDVSEAGDWSAVKVENGSGSYGRTNPVSGFIYPPNQVTMSTKG